MTAREKELADEFSRGEVPVAVFQTMGVELNNDIHYILSG
jgi:hypothetical protein